MKLWWARARCRQLRLPGLLPWAHRPESRDDMGVAAKVSYNPPPPPTCQAPQTQGSLNPQTTMEGRCRGVIPLSGPRK